MLGKDKTSNIRDSFFDSHCALQVFKGYIADLLLPKLYFDFCRFYSLSKLGKRLKKLPNNPPFTF